MTTNPETVVFNSSLGTSSWKYSSENNKAWGYFSASGVTNNNINPFDLIYKHVFFSNKLSDTENKKIISDLSAILKSIGAINIHYSIDIVTSVAQQINISYTIPKVKQKNIDSLSTTIASVTMDLINNLSNEIGNVSTIKPKKNNLKSIKKKVTFNI
jgi:hypothetical protein